MADISILVAADDTQVTKAVKSVGSLQKTVQSLSGALDKNQISNAQYNKGLKEGQRELQKLGLSHQKATSEVRKYAKAIGDDSALKRKAAATRAAEADTKRAADTELKAYQQSRREASAENSRRDQSSAATKRQAAEIDRLTNKYKPLYAASKQYERALDELASAHSLGVISTKQHEGAIESLSAEYQQFQAGSAGWSNQFVQGSNMAGKSANRMGMATQQAGYQVGDFIVQLQGGANPFVAFGQQATQLVGVMGMMNPALIGVGAALGIIIPLMTAVGAAFYTSHKTAKEAADGANKFEDSLKSAREEIKKTTGDLELLASGFQNVFEKTLSDEVVDATKKLDEANADLMNSMVALQGLAAAGGIDLGSIIFGDPIENAEKRVAVAKEELAALQAQLDTKAAMYANDEAQDLQGRLDILKLEVQYGEDNYRVREEIYLQERAAYELELQKKGVFEDTIASILEQKDAAFELSEQLENSGNLAKLIKDTMESIDLSGVIGQAEVLATKLSTVSEKAYSAMMAAYNKNLYAADVGRGRGGDPREFGLNRSDLVENTPEVQLSDTAAAVRDAANKARDKAAKEAGKSPQEQLAEFLTKKKEEANLQSQLVGLFNEERDLKSELIKFEQEYGDVANERQSTEFEATLKQLAADKGRNQVLEDARKQQEALANSIAQTMGNSLMSVVDKTKTTAEAFKDMAASIIKQLFEILVVQRMVGSFKVGASDNFGLAGFIGGLMPSADGNVISSGSVVPYAKGGAFTEGQQIQAYAKGGAFTQGQHIQAYAKGGVVSSATMFPMSGNKTGLMGEAGPEAIMPLKRGANGKLGVQMEGGGGDTIVVNQSFNFQANGDDTVKRLIAQAAPKIAQMTKSSLLDDRRRGGSTKAAFG